MNKRLKKLLWLAPAIIVGMAIFVAIGGELVMLLWNWLTPSLFGFSPITFWQALGILALCRILFGGFGLGGGGRRSHNKRRVVERWEQMTPEERERFRQATNDRSSSTTPLDSSSTA